MPESGAESVIRSGLPMSCLLQMKQEGFCNFSIHMSSFICFTFLFGLWTVCKNALYF